MSGNHSSGHLDDWALGDSWLHRRDARAKILAALALLIGLSFTRDVDSAVVALAAWLLVIVTGTAGLPMLAVVFRAAAVLPFALTFALITWFIGDHARAEALLAKSFLSAWVVVLLIGSTRITMLMAGFERLGVPSLLTQVILMLVRYLSVLGGRAGSMKRAAVSRGASGWGALPWGVHSHRRAGAGMFASLFRDAMDRATRIHQAMLARGFAGHFPLLRTARWTSGDSLLVAASIAAMLAANLTGARG